jgi:hypothetical protein
MFDETRCLVKTIVSLKETNMVSMDEIAEICSRSGIRVGQEESPAGRELAYQADPERIIVVHFSESDWPKLVARDLEAIIEMEPEWVLFHRHGTLNAKRCGGTEANETAKKMVKYFDVAQHESHDLYLLAVSGSAFLAFDHHLMPDGMPMHFSSVTLAGQVLLHLNALGNELEVFTKNG